MIPGWDLPLGGELEAAPVRSSGRAGRGMPSHAQLAYAKELMTVVLLALAFPWLLRKLLTAPGDVVGKKGL